MTHTEKLHEASYIRRRYQLRALLGEGGFGQVFEAWDPSLQRSVALKRLKPELSRGHSDQLTAEARMAASLHHPAFVQIYGLEDDVDGQSIIMELVRGITLRQLLAQSPLERDLMLDIVGQLADAMAQAHDAGLVHGDLKPANLMLEPSGQLRIMDFGLARKMDPLSTVQDAAHHAQGTVAYLAPETLLGKPPDQLGDIYAVGVLMYEMMHAKRPFAHLNGLALAAAHIQSSAMQWSFSADISPALTQLVQTLSARDPAARLPNMRAVACAVQALRINNDGQHGQLPIARPSLRSSRAKLKWRRYLVGTGATCVLVVAVKVASWPLQLPLAPTWSPYYSDAARLSSGLSALYHFDRDNSLNQAEADFHAILANRPNHSAAAAGLALTYALRYAGDRSDESWLQRADASAQLALMQDDQLAQGFAAQSLVRQLQGRNDEALQLAEHALRLDPRNLFALNGRTSILIRMRRFYEAERCMEAALRLYPNERILLDQLGILYFKQGDYSKAELAFRRSIAVEPDAVFAYANLNAALLHQGRNDEALHVLQQGLQIRPSGQLYSNLGTSLFERGDYLGAAQAFEHAVSYTKGRGNAYLHWANLADTLRWIPGREQASQRAYHEAAALLEPLLAHAPNDSTYASRMGLYAAKLNESSRAALLSSQAMARAPDSADVHFRAAVAYEILGQRDVALAALHRARQLGYPTKLINSEPDLLALRSDPRFRPLDIGSKL